MIASSIQRIEAGSHLTMTEMSDVMDQIMQGRCSESQMASLLLALHEKGETCEEIAGAAAALRRHMTPIRTHRPHVLDTCGTGGDRSGTFNISTAAALVTAAAGVPVAKHGNRSITSRSGSADVLLALGVNIDADVPTVQRCLDELGICFCFAPLMHPSMKHVSAVRKKLGVPTIFNLLGPLCNPASASCQLLGVGRGELRPLLANALLQLGTHRAAVVCGSDGLDEVTLSGPTHVSLIRGDSLEETAWSPDQFGLAASDLAPLAIDGPDSSAHMIRRVLAGHPGVARDIVLMNASAALWIAGACSDLHAGTVRAAQAIDSGAAADLLIQLAKLSHTQTNRSPPNG